MVAIRWRRANAARRSRSRKIAGGTVLGEGLGALAVVTLIAAAMPARAGAEPAMYATPPVRKIRSALNLGDLAWMLTGIEQVGSQAPEAAGAL